MRVPEHCHIKKYELRKIILQNLPLYFATREGTSFCVILNIKCDIICDEWSQFDVHVYVNLKKS